MRTQHSPHSTSSDVVRHDLRQTQCKRCGHGIFQYQERVWIARDGLIGLVHAWCEVSHG